MRGGLGVVALAAACTFDANVGAGGGDTDGSTTGNPDPSTSSANGSMSSASETTPSGTSSSTSSDATTGGSSSSDGGESNASSTTAAESESGITSEGCEPGLEVCDGVDNDCDQGIDEGSAGNALCGGCTFVPATDGDYFALCPGPLDWDQSRNACAGFGPTVDLAVIDDGTDQAGLLLLVAADYWVGVSDVAEEGHWVFVDGTDSVVDGSHVGYDGWAAGQPSGGLVENCAELDPGQAGWADSPCEQPQPFICRHPP